MKSRHAEFGTRLREAMRRAGLGEGPKELADLVSSHGGEAVTLQAAFQWIRGKTSPRRANLLALARILGTTPEYLLGEESAGRKSLGEPKGGAAIPARDRLAIDAYLALPVKRRKLVRELIEALGSDGQDH